MIQLCILFILSWILTVVVEGGAARLFFGIEKKEQILLLLVNTVTNPVAVLLSILLPVYTGILQRCLFLFQRVSCSGNV